MGRSAASVSNLLTLTDQNGSKAAGTLYHSRLTTHRNSTFAFGIMRKMSGKLLHCFHLEIGQLPTAK